MKKHSFCIFLIALTLPHFTNAQVKARLDSFYQQAILMNNDTMKAWGLYRLGFYYTELNRDTAIQLLDQSIAIADKIKQPLTKAASMLHKAYNMYHQSKFIESYKLVNEAIEITSNPASEKGSKIFSFDNPFQDPKSLRLYVLAGTHLQMGHMKNATGNRESSIFYYHECIRISEPTNDLKLATLSYMNIGSVFLDENMLDSADYYFRKSLQYGEVSGNDQYTGYTLLELAFIQMKTGNLDSARIYSWQSLKSSQENENLASEITAHHLLATIYDETGATDSLMYYAFTSMSKATAFNDVNSISKAAELYARGWKKSGNMDSAYHYETISRTNLDEIFKKRISKLSEFQSQMLNTQIQLEKDRQDAVAYKSRIKTTGFIAGIGLLVGLLIFFYRNNKQKQKANKILEKTLTDLKATQGQLVQSEKMASLGELTAGIAHEIQNPLNFINNFSEISAELVDEINVELEKGEIEEARSIGTNIKENLVKINHHGKRADAIVKNMLQHSRAGSGQKEAADINALCDEYLRLSYHGLRAKDKSFNATLVTDFDKSISRINIVPQDIGRVLMNLLTNAFYTVNEKSKRVSAHSESENGNGYSPMVSVQTKRVADKVEILVSDNGHGIPTNIANKIFQPFFTTKPSGQGTGLGLSLSYDLIKSHGGELKVETAEGKGSTFIITIPI